MFTGIVEAVGKVTAIERRGEITQLDIEAPQQMVSDVRIGDSISVNGACLTVCTGAEAGLRFEAVPETLEKTSLGGLERGGRVNLERALRADGRLDGHMVQGHVDGVGTVSELRREGEDVRLFVRCGPEVSEFLVEKGSITVDGVSLTVVGVRPEGFDVALIPHTLHGTTLGALGSGSFVNLEVDVIAKYVRRYLERFAPARS